MAANLNPPSHFSQPVVGKKAKASDGSQLRPPSSFEFKQASADPWKALAKAKGKINELQEENKQLQLRRTKPREDSTVDAHRGQVHSCNVQPRVIETVSSTMSPHHYHHLEHTADILSKQATELAQVKSEVMTLRSQRESQVRELEERLRKAEVKYVTETTSLAMTNKCQEEEHRMQITMMKTKYEAETCERQDKIERLGKELSRTRIRLEKETSQLKEQLQTSEDERDQIAADLKTSNLEKDSTIASLQIQLSQLKTYIGDTQSTSRTTSQWQLEIDKQRKKIKELERDVENQRSAVQLLNVRLSSATEILTIQESELSRVKGESVDNGKKLQILLTRWREKVFELLVQLKSQDIVEETITRNHKWQVADLDENIISLRNKCQLLEHTIADRDAQLELERVEFQSLQEELMSVQQVAELLDSKLNGYEEAVPRLASLLQSFQVTHNGHEEKLNTASAKLASFDHRVSFAVSRINILKGLLARKDAIRRLGEEDKLVNQSEQTVGNKIDEGDKDSESNRLTYQELAMELHRVTHERDALATRIKQDTETMQQQYDTIKSKFESRQEQDASMIQELQLQVQQQSKSLESISTKLDRAETECQESTKSASKLKMELAKLQLTTDRASAEKMAARESQLTDQLLEMEHKVNNARREQAKAVVSLRHLERQVVRERERSAEILKTQEEELRLEIERLRSQLRGAEKDCNLLMATLKQEGLIGQFKTQRAVSRRVDGDDENSEPTETIRDSARTSLAEQPTKQKAPLSAILSDLQSLTAEVLKDDEGGSNHSDENSDKG
ncbi:coiled-coil alpha-helical rod protein 1-like isoform X1 [Asterias rubens]|uniref:coiled-coil alpha-helical rod protein 1-like isoform X1 n=1 Tax=Asterias rubens TaxID=7604 RepID=UPI00145514AB|nr:coiled-coil alpha-helical rod protein 1-like isoform X1 [Asterias rubens]XP_033643566.1 coiled-coil alpha-helical rod protein 1-like isoform X1 [Asterias rubens]